MGLISEKSDSLSRYPTSVEWDRQKEVWGAPKARIDRFQKKNGEYRSQSKFKFTSAKQAQQIMDVFKKWIDSGMFSGDEE